MIWVAFWLAVYLVTAWWAFRTLLRSWFDEFGPEWEGVGFASLGLIPVAGLAGALSFWIAERDNPRTSAAPVPAWLKQIGGVK